MRIADGRRSIIPAIMAAIGAGVKNWPISERCSGESLRMASHRNDSTWSRRGADEVPMAFDDNWRTDASSVTYAIVAEAVASANERRNAVSAPLKIRVKL